jgi:hypothetical protein
MRNSDVNTISCTGKTDPFHMELYENVPSRFETHLRPLVGAR